MRRLILGSTLLLVGCHNNAAYVDLATQQLRPCTGDVVSSISIENTDSIADAHSFDWQQTGPRPSAFLLTGPQTGFVLDEEDRGADVQEKPFVLQPDSRYEVRNGTNGDAAEGVTVVETDATGRIVRASRTACE